MASLMRVRAVINYGLGGPGLGTFYFLGTAFTPSSADALDCAGRVRAFYAAMSAQLTTAAAVLVQGQVDTIDEATGVLDGGLSVTPPAAVAGTGSGQQLPATQSIVVRLQTATIVSGRRIEGRSFVGPLAASASTTGGLPVTAVGTATANAITALLTGATASVPVVWHRPKAAGSGIGGAIVGGSAWSLFGSLRSRRD